MYNEIKTWLKKDKYNIFLTVLCTLLSLVPSLLSFNINNQGDNSNDSNVKPIIMMGANLILVLVGMWMLAYKYRPTALDDIRDKQTLKDYIEEVCGIKQTLKNDSESAYNVVKGTVRQFFTAWQIIWLLWIIYYMIELFLNLGIVIGPAVQSIEVIKYFIDFITSAALFSVYFILNNATVNISDRTQKNEYSIFNSIATCVIILGVLIVLQVLYLSDSSEIHRDSLVINLNSLELNLKSSVLYSAPSEIYNDYTKLILGFFSTISFVLVLGKLNSSYLKVPRVLMFMLYIYAIYQIFISLESTHNNQRLNDALRNIRVLEPWVFIFGKTALLMTLSWILYKKRLIFYIIHESLSITENEGRLNKFNRYISE